MVGSSDLTLTVAPVIVAPVSSYTVPDNTTNFELSGAELEGVSDGDAPPTGVPPGGSEATGVAPTGAALAVAPVPEVGEAEGVVVEGWSGIEGAQAVAAKASKARASFEYLAWYMRNSPRMAGMHLVVVDATESYA